MLGEATSTWRESRREAAIATILDAAWALARRDGVAALSLSEVARTVGMKPPMAPGATLRDALRVGMGRFLSFSVEDPARHQLLFQRTIPGFVPSEASMAVANEAYGQTRAYLAAHGITEQADLDLLTAVSTGLADQQISNDPGGDRWLRQLDRAVDMLAAALERRPTRKRGKR